MSDFEGYEQRRVSAYLRQTGRKVLTAAQRRRLRKKTNKRAKDMAETLAMADTIAETFGDFGPVPAPDWSLMKVADLRSFAKEYGLKGYSKARKDDLVKMLREYDDARGR